MNASKFRINYPYLLKVCENLATVHDQEIVNVLFKNSEIIIQFQSHIDLIIPVEQFKEILIDQISSELRINCVKLGNFELSEDNRFFIDVIAFEYE